VVAVEEGTPQEEEEEDRATGRKARPITDVANTAPERKKGDLPLRYSGRTSLRREQCDAQPKSRSVEVEAGVHCQPTAG
jgi:hypothetical protein